MPGGPRVAATVPLLAPPLMGLRLGSTAAARPSGCTRGYALSPAAAFALPAVPDRSRTRGRTSAVACTVTVSPSRPRV